MTSKLRTCRSAFLMLCIVTLGATIAIGQSNPRDLFERARLLEENASTLDQAVRTYEQVVALAKSERALAADAQLHIALIRERQGRPEARGLFAEIIKAYPEQSAVVTAARTRLSTAPADIVARRVWSGPVSNTQGRPSLDGRYLTFVDWTTNSGNVGVRDLMTGETRLLTHAAGNSGVYADAPVLSPDNSEVAYIWEDAEIRLVRFDGSHDRLLVKPDGYPAELVWSPDGRQLGAVLTDPGHTQRIVVIPVRDKAAPVTLKSTGWNFPVLGGFSPDGKYLVFSLDHTPPAFDGGIFAMAVDGSREITLVQTSNEDHSPMWTPDGRGIVFVSDRSGKPALWHAQFRDGAVQGEPQLLRTAIGDVNMGFTRDGSYFYGTRNLQRDAYLVKIDPDTLTAGTPARLTDRFVGSSSAPAFSPDGTRVAFMGNGPTLSLVIRSLADGTERTLPTRFPLGASFGPEWFPDGRALLVGETAYPTGRAIFRRVDADTGADTPFFTTAYGGIYGKVRFSPDGRSLFYSFRTGGDLLHLMRRDLATGQETDLYHVNSDGVGLFGLSLSPDGKWLAFNLNVPPGKNGEGPRAMQVLSVDGGEARELMRGGYSCPAPGNAAWTRDGRYLLAVCADGQRRRLLAVPSDGSANRKLDIVMDQIGSPTVSPDGRVIAFTAIKREPEVWTVANLLSSVR